MAQFTKAEEAVLKKARSKMGVLGGRARALKLTPEQRQAIARLGGKARALKRMPTPQRGA